MLRAAGRTRKKYSCNTHQTTCLPATANVPAVYLEQPITKPFTWHKRSPSTWHSQSPSPSRLPGAAGRTKWSSSNPPVTANLSSDSQPAVYLEQPIMKPSTWHKISPSTPKLSILASWSPSRQPGLNILPEATRMVNSMKIISRTNKQSGSNVNLLVMITTWWRWWPCSHRARREQRAASF